MPRNINLSRIHLFSSGSVSIILEHLYRGATWDIKSKSAEFKKRDSNTIEFTVTIPPDGSQTVIHTVHYTW